MIIIGDGFDSAEQHMLWYTGGAAVDRAIEQAFGPWVEKALAAQLPQWQQSPEGLIALVILLDQFTMSNMPSITITTRRKTSIPSNIDELQHTSMFR